MELKIICTESTATYNYDKDSIGSPVITALELILRKYPGIGWSAYTDNSFGLCKTVQLIGCEVPAIFSTRLTYAELKLIKIKKAPPEKIVKDMEHNLRAALAFFKPIIANAVMNINENAVKTQLAVDKLVEASEDTLSFKLKYKKFSSEVELRRSILVDAEECSASLHTYVSSNRSLFQLLPAAILDIYKTKVVQLGNDGNLLLILKNVLEVNKKFKLKARHTGEWHKQNLNDAAASLQKDFATILDEVGEIVKANKDIQKIAKAKKVSKTEICKAIEIDI